MVTRRLLIDAARRIFARDGFELTRLEDIAAAAGKTRGAFYAHFRDKEDVFYAIFEQDIARDQAKFSRSLSKACTHAERLQIITKHMESVIKDRKRMLLNLEFKMYAVRHPQRPKRFAELHAAMCSHNDMADCERLLPKWNKLTTKQQRSETARVSALLDGLALNRLFDPVGLTNDCLTKSLTSGVASLISEK